MVFTLPTPLAARAAIDKTMPPIRQFSSEGDGYHEFVFNNKNKLMVPITLFGANDASLATL
jgi:hypothetical protein